MRIPDKLCVANLPTPIQCLDNINPNPNWSTLYIKRDDYSGFEISGNKVRNLEYHFFQAVKLNCDVIITCGGLQSNHSRATASLSARFSLKCHLLLIGPDAPPDGNYLFDNLFGAEVTIITSEQYNNSKNEIMEQIASVYRSKGYNPFIIPEGGANGLGLFAYYSTYLEIMKQERELGIHFDVICTAVGTGGTYAGLYAANELYCGGKTIVGFNITASEGSRERVIRWLNEGDAIAKFPCPIPTENIYINADYLGGGYGDISPELVDFISKTANSTGIVTDPVYSGKSLMGTVSEIAKRNPLLKGNVLFIHTGGQLGIFPHKELFY